MFNKTHSLLQKMVKSTILSVGAFMLFFCILGPVNVFANEEVVFSEEIAMSESVPDTVSNNENDTVILNVPPTETNVDEDSNQDEITDVAPPVQEPDSEITAPVVENPSQQSTDYSCGPTALAIWINKLGGEATEKELIELAKTNAEEGTTFLNLRNAAREKGFANAVVYKLDYTNLGNLSLPALLFINVDESSIGHYIVLFKIEDGKYYIIDPIDGLESVKTEEEIKSEFGEYALIKEEIIIKQVKIESTLEKEGTVVTVEKINNDQVVNPPVEQVAVSEPQKAALKVATDEELSQIRGKGLPALGVLYGLSAHGINQLISRGISPTMIANTLRAPQAILVSFSRYGVQFKYIGTQAVIVLNQWGQLITSWRR